MRIMRTFMRMKNRKPRKAKKEGKERTNLTLKSSAKKMGIDKANLKRVSLSELVELAIYDYNAE